MDRSKQLDAKAMALTGNGAVIMALLVSAFSARASAIIPAAWIFTVAAGWIVAVAVASALWAVKIAGFRWFSDADWFGAGQLQDAERLRRFHLLVIHHVKCQHDEINERKARRLKWSYTALSLAGGLLAVALLLQAGFHR